MPKSAIPRGVRSLACGCYIIRQKGKVICIVTCKEHHYSAIPIAKRKARRKRTLD